MARQALVIDPAMTNAVAAVLVVVLVLLALIMHGLREPTRLTTRRYRFALPGLAGPVRLVHLTDTHGSVTFSRLDLFRALSLLGPDLIAFTGDLTDREGDLEAAASAIGALTTIAPVFFVPGNHDLHAGANRGDLRALERLASSAGVETLTNSGRHFAIGQASLWLGGVDDAVKGRPEVAAARPSAEFANMPRVLLSHSPDVVLEITRGEWDLVLAGHTHGGQIRLPFVGPLITNSVTGRRFWRGPSRFCGATVVVSQGLGTASLPIRFLCPPEVIILDLQPQPVGV